MTPESQDMNPQIEAAAPVKDWRQRRSTRAMVFVLTWCVSGLGYAVDFPTVPLQTGVVQPAPNVIFILDDSLSMTSNGGDDLDTGLTWCTNAACPNQPGTGSPGNFPVDGPGAAYTKNALSYNPRTTYLPWASANTTNTNVERLANASYTAASSNLQLASGSNVNLSSNVQTFFVLKPNATNPADKRQYYRFQILTGSPGRVVRAEWVNTASPTTNPKQSTLGCNTTNAGTWGWKNCVDVSANGDSTTGVRALAAEKQNYANWYQYHRTRMKAAKAGGSEAFAALDENYRVGIMGLYPSGSNQQVLGGSSNGSAPTTTSPNNLNNVIPVANNGGLFIGANRKNWFDHLHGMQGKAYTPLRKALDAAGKYFSTLRAYESKDASGTTYLACRQNFAILTTDGYWNNWNGSDDPDSNYSGNKISGDEENGTTITGPNNQTYRYERRAPYWYNGLGDYNDTTTLADIAMHYWKTDLRTSDDGHPGSADNRVPFSVANPAFWQHMVTFGVGLGVRGKLTDAQVAHAVAGTGTSANGGYWPAPVHATNANENPQNVDDLRHAALNSRGSYVNANDSEEFAKGISEALNRIGERRGSASNVLANSTSISTESFIYQATYTAGTWRGELLAYPISSAGLGAPEWRAGERIPAWDLRNIFTADAVSGGSTFPNGSQAAALDAAATTLALGVTGSELAQYLKGDGSLEKRNAGPLRDRTMRNTLDQVVPALLGDIVDSSPYYAADIQTLFVGANDGMLHAIDASNTAPNATNTSGGGTERFAYVPRGVVMAQLAQLADPMYGSNTTTKAHRYFVDGPIVVSARARTPGKNYLVGGLGRGGRGVYGLDVTSPATFSVANVLWDLTGDAAPDNMGQVISEPLISKLNNGVTAAVVANGPNSASGTASLFIIDLATGATIRELNTGTTNNGLSAPRAVDVNADGQVDFFFAGDLQGNMWRFDVRANNTGAWTFNKLFSASDANNNAQPITSGPGVARDPDTGKIWIFFGTGQYMTSADQVSTAVQSYYGVMVGKDGTEGTNLTRSSLHQRLIKIVDPTSGLRAFESNEHGVGAGKEGWYLDLNNPAGKGERVISSPLIYDNILVFSSIVPPGQETVNSCEAGGSGYVNAIDAFSGTGLPTSFFDYAPDSVSDGNGTSLPLGSLPIRSGMPTAPIIIGDKLVIGDSSGGQPTAINVFPPGGNSTRRISWRELFND
jgi:type IV pilus assembly protein PilY1